MGDLLLPDQSQTANPVICICSNVSQSGVEQVAHSSMREKFLFKFLTGHEKKKNLDWMPEHSHLPETMNAKLIISTSRNENELRCKMIKVTDIMFLHPLHFFKRP